MRLIQNLLVLVLSIVLLMTLWPLFVFLMIILVIYWIVIKNRVQKAAQDINNMNQSYNQTHSNPDIIDVEVLDEREEK